MRGPPRNGPPSSSQPEGAIFLPLSAQRRQRTSTFQRRRRSVFLDIREQKEYVYFVPQSAEVPDNSLIKTGITGRVRCRRSGVREGCSLDFPKLRWRTYAAGSF